MPDDSGPDYAAELAEVTARIAEVQAELAQHGSGHPGYGELLLMLGFARLVKFSITGDRADLNEGIEDLTRAAAALPPGGPERAMALAGLAEALIDRSQRTGQSADLDTGIRVARDALVSTPAGTHEWGTIGTVLGNALTARYERAGHLADLDEAISRYQAVAGEKDQDVTLSNMGLALRMRFERTSDPADLEASIQALRSALAACPVNHPHRAEYLGKLGMSLTRRFQLSGTLTDADDAITALRGAVTGMSPGDPDLPGVHSNLAIMLMLRHDRTGEVADLDAAISASQRATDTFDRTDPRWAGMAGNLSQALYRRYQRTGDMADLDAAIAKARSSVAATRSDNPDYAAPVTQLGNLLHARYVRTADPGDLDGAIQATYRAVDGTPADHVERANALANLGVSLRSRFWLTGLQADRDAALSALLAAIDVPHAPASIRARASIGAGLLSDDPAQAAGLLDDAVRLLPQVATRHLARGDQQHAIGIFAGITDAAALAALADPTVPDRDRPATALALLEAGRAVLLSQALETRDDLTDLRRDRQDLADRFVTLRDQMDTPARPMTVLGDPVAALGQETAERARLADDLAGVLRDIRLLDGFAGFGLPPSVGELCAQASDGPLVVFVIGDRGGAALLLSSDDVDHVELPGLTDEAITGRVNAFHNAIENDDGQTLTEILQWLWDAAAGPVLHALGYRTRPVAEPWPRVWWVPTGKLALLPVHAAGHHSRPSEPGEPARSVMDAVISSYTPTVRALRYARQRAKQREPGRALIVAMPVTPGQGALLGVAEEAKVARAVLPGPLVLAEPAEGAGQAPPGSLPTRDNVLRLLPACTIAHFACHAESDAADPSRSHLLLSDYATDPLTVAALAPVDHERLELTYLSACSTAFTGAGRLADEAIHLTSAFLLAGSRHVVGTLWPANDLVAVRIARQFYAGLRTKDDEVDTGQAAVALHEAVRACRERWPDEPFLWAPYLHAGA